MACRFAGGQQQPERYWSTGDSNLKKEKPVIGQWQPVAEVWTVKCDGSYRENTKTTLTCTA